MIEGFLARLGGIDGHHFDEVVGICASKEEAFEVARHAAAKYANENGYGYFSVTQHFSNGGHKLVSVNGIDADGFIEDPYN